MIESIRALFKDLSSGNLKKGSVTESLDYATRNIKEQIIPILDSFISSKNLPTLKNNPKLSKLGRDLDFKGSNPVAVLTELKAFYTKILNGTGKLQDSINKYLSTNISSKAISVKDGTILRIVSDITSMGLYILDFLYLALLGNEKSGLPKAHINHVDAGYLGFAELVRHYNKEFDKIVDSIKDISAENINFDADDAVLNQFFVNNGKFVNLPSRGFVGNPIYHFRMWLADLEYKKYEKNRETKRLLELRLMALQAEMAKEGVDVNKLNKQIEYYEELISDIEFKIDKYEKSLE